MRHFLLIILLGLATRSVHGEPLSLFRSYTAGHMDIEVRVVDGELVGYWKNDGSAVIDGAMSLSSYPAAGARALGVFDAATPAPPRPANSDWAFLGMAAGEPVYRLPSGGVPATLPYLGFGTEHPSLAQLGADSFRFTLVNMTGPEDGVFSLYRSSTDVPMNTMDGFPAGSITLGIGGHEHYNWGFSRLGTYDLYFEVEALDGATVITNMTDMFRFQITDGGGFDSYDHWRRTIFTPEQIEDDEISGPNATPLDDGIQNIQRYAFGMEPRIDFVWIEEDDELVPGVVTHQRHQSGEISPTLGFATSLEPSNWEEADLTLVETESIFHDPGMEIRTYRVETTNAPMGFLRLQSMWETEP